MKPTRATERVTILLTRLVCISISGLVLFSQRELLYDTQVTETLTLLLCSMLV